MNQAILDVIQRSILKGYSLQQTFNACKKALKTKTIDIDLSITIDNYYTKEKRRLHGT